MNIQTILEQTHCITFRNSDKGLYTLHTDDSAEFGLWELTESIDCYHDTFENIHAALKTLSRYVKERNLVRDVADNVIGFRTDKI